MKDKASWAEDFPGAITVCDMQGIIVEMNAKARETFAKYGNIIGKDLRDCHSPKSVAKIEEMLETGESNIYTIEKNGIRKLIYQVPWFKDGRRMGLAELSLEIPKDMPHFKRD